MGVSWCIGFVCVFACVFVLVFDWLVVFVLLLVRVRLVNWLFVGLCARLFVGCLVYSIGCACVIVCLFMCLIFVCVFACLFVWVCSFV